MPSPIPTITSAKALHDFHANYCAKFAYSSKEIGLGDLTVDTEQDAKNCVGPRWSFDSQKERLSPACDTLFDVSGRQVSTDVSAGKYFKQAIINECGDPGICGLVVDKKTDHVLIGIRHEPGNTQTRLNYGIIGPSVQGSAANLKNARNNPNYPLGVLLGVLEGLGFSVDDPYLTPQDGNRFAGKDIGYRLVYVDGKEELKNFSAPNLVWTSVEALAAELNRPLCGANFMQNLAHELLNRELARKETSPGGT